MHILKRTTGNLAKIAIALAVFIYTSTPALAQGTGGLLGIQPGFPQLDTTGAVGQTCAYDSTTGVLTIESTPNLYFPDGNTLNFVNGGLVTITATVDALGGISSGSIVVNGTTSGGLGDPLLTGGLSATYGLSDTNPTPGATDQGDFRFTATGGSILTDVAPAVPWPAGYDIGATLTLEGSTYAGSLAEDWTCARAKLIIGPVEGEGEPPTEGACSQGFWKNHPSDWPVNNLVLGSIVYTQAELITILKSKPKGDKSIVMAKQLIAAKLNVAGGSDPSCIAATIDAADAWLDANAPGGIPSGDKNWNGGEDIKEDLDLYNNGELCAGSCTR